MDNGNVGPGQMMGQWNNFEAPQYNPNRHNLDPLMNQESMEAGIEQRVEQLPNNMNLVNQGPPNAYENANIHRGVISYKYYRAFLLICIP